MPLLYEPGNWGDVLKGEWLCCFLQWWADGGNRRLRYLDPFCGQWDYPITEPARRRWALAPRYAAAMSDRLLSSAALVDHEARRLGLELEARRSDREQNPLDLLGAADLLLFDPYDYFERWPDWTDALLACSQQTTTLVYLLNKAPRGASQFRQYRDMRKRWEGRALRVGRIPSDAVLPRAWHELWLVGPGAASQALGEQLRALTLDMNAALLAESCWESA